MAKKATRYIPEGDHSVTPYFIVEDANRAIDFYKRALNAQELVRMPMPDGRIGHAELRIGDSKIMLADESPQALAKSPKALGATTFGFALYVEDCEQVFQRALDAGGKVLRPIQDQFYGDRNGTFQDPFGHVWTVATHKEDLSPEEMNQRLAAMTK